MAGLLVAASTWPSGARADEPAGAVVLIGTGGIGWSDVDEQTTPNLWQLLRDGSSAALSVRSVYPNTCPIDGWLGVSAGARAAAPRPGTAPNPANRPCPNAPAVANGSVLQWPAYLAAAADERFDSRLGLLGETAALGKVCVKAVEPFAAAGGARRDGRIEQYSAWSDQEMMEDLNGCPVTLVDVGSRRDRHVVTQRAADRDRPPDRPDHRGRAARRRLRRGLALGCRAQRAAAARR